MLEPTIPGWKVETIGDDIAWMRIGEDGRLWAVNPEYGFFGVAPGTDEHTNPNAMRTINQGQLGLHQRRADRRRRHLVGGPGEPPAHATSWKGEAWTPDSDELSSHPNSRYCTPIKQCPILAAGVRRPARRPDRRDLLRRPPQDHDPAGDRGPRLAARHLHGRDAVARETTAAATGQVGVVRRDPMAMLPFIGYNAGDYFSHWIDVGKDADAAKLPKIFYVNWFRRDDDGGFLWPGFGENIRVLKWVIERIEGTAAAVETPIGHVPTPESLDIDGPRHDRGGARAGASPSTSRSGRPRSRRSRSGSTSSASSCPTVLWTELDGLKARLGV